MLISGKVSRETGNTKTDGHMVHRLPYDASLTTRNPFMRWLSACNATNLGLMRNTGAAWRRRRLPTITKRISENPDVLCIQSDSAEGLLERCLIELCALHRDLYPPKIFFELLYQCCVRNVFFDIFTPNSDRLIAIQAGELNYTMYGHWCEQNQDSFTTMNTNVLGFFLFSFFYQSDFYCVHQGSNDYLCSCCNTIYKYHKIKRSLLHTIYSSIFFLLLLYSFI